MGHHGRRSAGRQGESWLAWLFRTAFQTKSATTLGSYRSGFRDFIGHFGTTQATGNGYFYGDCRDIGDIGAGANIDRLPMIVIHDP